jgi:hypothetical protein
MGREPWQQSAFLDVCTLGGVSRSLDHAEKNAQ